jgi:hypothetical protein
VDPFGAQRSREALDEWLRLLWGRGSREPRAISAGGLGKERELAHHQGGSSGVDDRPVEAPVLVREHPQTRDLGCKPLRSSVVVVVLRTHQDE